MLKEPIVKNYEPYGDYSHKAKTRRISHTCLLCGKKEEANWNPETNERLIKNQVCYYCDLWVRTLAQDEINPIWFAKLVINGKRYTAKPLVDCETTDKPVVVLENLKTGDRQRFCNLKIVSVVPSHFLSQFPDNAKIIVDDPEFPTEELPCN